MFLNKIFNNNFEFLIPEFFLITFLLLLLLFCVFYKKNKNFLIINTLNTITIYLLLIVLILLFNIQNYSCILINGLFLINNFTQIIKIILIITFILFFFIQKEYLIQQKIISYEIIILLLISLLGLMLLISSNNFILLYLGLELQNLSFYILTASQKKSLLSIEAALKYFILGVISSSFILFGISILYFILGSLNFSNISLILLNINFLENINILISIIYAFIFFIIGIVFKIGAAPFHYWLPDIYEGSPNNITTLFAIIPKIVFVGILINFFFNIFYPISCFLTFFFFLISFFSMFIGAISSLYQKKIKRLLAYSSINHVGFIFIGFSSNLLNNIPYILFYILFYIIMSINIWTSFISININNKPLKYLTDFCNLYKINKIISIIILLNIFSFIGIPPIIGFFSKFFIFVSSIKNDYFSLIFFALIISIISSFYYLKIIKIIFFEIKNKKIFFNKIEKIKTIILLITSFILIFSFSFLNIILVFLNKIYLNFII